MPVYDFQCIPCNTTIELQASMKQPLEIPYCSSCNKEMARQYTVPGLIFNGAGFYSTDNRK